MPPALEVFPSEAIELFLRFGEVRKICLNRDQGMARRRRSKEELKELDALVERLREFIRVNYTTAAEIGVRDSAVYRWLQGESRPMNPKRITEFLDSLPNENGPGIAPTGYVYREYKNWRGIPKP